MKVAALSPPPQIVRLGRAGVNGRADSKAAALLITLTNDKDRVAWAIERFL